MTLRALRNISQYFVEYPSSQICQIFFFSWLDCGYGMFGGKTTEENAIFITAYQRWTLSTGNIAADPGHYHLLRKHLSGFSTVKLCFLFLLFPTVLFGRKPLCPAHTFQSGELCSTSLRMRQLYKLIGIFCMEDYSPLLVCLSTLYDIDLQRFILYFRLTQYDVINFVELLPLWPLGYLRW